MTETLTTQTDKLGGVSIARRFIVAYTNIFVPTAVPFAPTGAISSVKRTDSIRAGSPSATWSDAGNLVTTTLGIQNGVNQGKVFSIRQPSGLTVAYDYNGTTAINYSGSINAGTGRFDQGARTRQLRNSAGFVIEDESFDIASGLQISGQYVTSTDERGRPTRLDYLDGTYSTATYACCGVDNTRSRDGVVTNYSYDALGRVQRVTTSAAGQSLSSEGYTFDAAGRQLTVTRYGTDNTPMLMQTNTYTISGRLHSSRDAVDRTTSYGQAFDVDHRTIETTIFPDGGTKIEILDQDGTLKSIAGTAAFARQFSYGTAADAEFGVCTITTEFKGPSTIVPEWIQTITDSLGRKVKVIDAAGNATRSYYDKADNIIKTIDSDGVTTLYGYDSMGRQDTVASDLNRDGVINFGGTDRIVKTVADFVVAHSRTVSRTSTLTWENDNQDSPHQVSLREQSVGGEVVWLAVDSLTTITTRSFDGLGGRVESVSSPDGSERVRSYRGSRLLSDELRASGRTLAQQSYSYDNFGRVQSLADARTGTTIYTYYNDDKLNTVLQPDPDLTRTGPGYDAPLTRYTYDAAGRLSQTTLPDNSAATNTYYPTGLLRNTSGSQTYPQEFSYDGQGRIKTLKTWQNFLGNSGTTLTTWNYDSIRGTLISKKYPDNTGPSYAYWPSGRLKSRTWVRQVNGAALVCNYAYNSAGDLSGVSYSDTTPAISMTYDRRGLELSKTDAAGTCTWSYHASGQLQNETYDTTGLLANLGVNRTFDAFDRLSSITAVSESATLTTSTFDYDGASRIRSVASGTLTATYDYLANSNLVQTLTFQNNGSTRLITTKVYDNLNRLTSSTNTPATVSTLSVVYDYNAVNQRTKATREDNAFWDLTYDSMGQLTSGTKKLADATPIPGYAFEYSYDDLGNRKTSTTGGASPRVSTYTSNTLNQYPQQTIPAVIDVFGAAKTDAAIIVNGHPTTRQGALFYKALDVVNSSASQYPQITITGVRSGVTAQDTHFAYLAKTPEVFTHDADGNLIADGKWSYTWDAENRLTSCETLTVAVTAGVPKQKHEFAYDVQGRRIQKKTSLWNSLTASYQVVRDLRFIYDDWNLLAEIDASAGLLTRSYMWGLDLSGSQRGAGGVGGLLALTGNNSTLLTSFDGNGNLSGLVNAADGTLSAEYEYDPFGAILKAVGPAANFNPFRYSTKYTDDETNLVYYGFRYYNPSVGRWLSRDPIEENGGVNLYGMIGNDPVNRWDFLGMGFPGDPMDPNTALAEVAAFESQAVMQQAAREGARLLAREAAARAAAAAAAAAAAGSLTSDSSDPDKDKQPDYALDKCLLGCGKDPDKDKDCPLANKSEKRKEWRKCLERCLKLHPPKEGWGYRPPKQGPKKTNKGWEDRRGHDWQPGSHDGTHAPHYDVQEGKSYRKVYPSFNK